MTLAPSLCQRPLCPFPACRRSVRPRLTVYVCQESPQESPLLERHGNNKNGEHSIASSLHGNLNTCCIASSKMSGEKKRLIRPNEVCSSPPLSSVAVYHALYLEELTAAELIRKMASVCNLPLGTINQVYRQGPTGIHILLSDQVRAPASPPAQSCVSVSPKVHKAWNPL